MNPFRSRDPGSLWSVPPRPRPLTFALVGGVGGQGVAVVTVLAAVAEEAGGAVDALQALAGLAVAVADGVGVNVVAALAGAAGPDRPGPPKRVPEEPVVTELAALPWRWWTGYHGDDGRHACVHTYTSCVYLWFLRGSWCRPPPGSWGPRHRWRRRDRDTAHSLLTTRWWRRHRNRLCSAHS